MKKILIAVLLCFGVLSANQAIAAVTLSGKYPACISANEFERLSSILQHEDQEAFEEIFKTSCFMPKKGVKVDKVVSMGWTSGVAHVKVYVKGNLYDLWTNTENLQSEKAGK
ncbi:hypothetical protein ACNJ8R_004397 [Cronobacter sakazakii]|nr:hypothetical protein [Escherichia coli]KDM86240.1 hypothetical protein DC22_15815 [Escherichia coli]KNF77158.1 hypothetical protein WQ89_20310 [Escherichia coli]KYR05672.1 hypothetical protein AML00_22830 [Escherichia coli]MCD6973422.1 hypothetical protein [Escherichia coli]MCV3058183.1 hypothetical protein [Escherichia coli]